jgi:hypothetical protein
MIGLIPDNNVKYIKPPGDFIFPGSVNYICPMPECGILVNFPLKWGSANSLLMFTESECPSCGKKSVFIYTDITINKGDKKKGKLYINPAPRIRHPLDGIREVEEFKKELFESYNSAIDAYNTRQWPATAVLCRRTLEGITKTLIPIKNQKKFLSQQLKELPNHKDLKKPILTLANAIKEGGNLGAHFDLKKIPNEEISTLMIDFLDYIIEYLDILPI